MQVNANILDVNIETLTNKAGKPYKIATVDYKDLDKNKAESRKVMSFGPSEKAFLYLASNNPRGASTLTLEKVGDYWNIVGVGPAGAAPQQAQPASFAAAAPSGGRVDDKERQVLIIRQSCLQRAIELAELNKNTKATKEQIAQDAEFFKEYVVNGLDQIAQAAFDDDVPL